MKTNKQAILNRIDTIISKVVDLQQLVSGDMDLQEVARKLSYVRKREEAKK